MFKKPVRLETDSTVTVKIDEDSVEQVVTATKDVIKTAFKAGATLIALGFVANAATVAIEAKSPQNKTPKK